MIEKPVVGMRVTVDDPDCCFSCFIEDGINLSGPGTIIEIADDDSFLVKVDEDLDSWWRCIECVTEIKE